ncbi:hypothetical protein D3C71_1016160 [compost metagenome]
MRRRRARGDQRGTDRRILARGEHRLQGVQGGEEIAERAAAERLACVLALMPAECLHALLARDALALVTEDHRIAIEGDAQLAQRSAQVHLFGRGDGLAGRLGQDRGCRDAVRQRAPDRVRVGRQEQIGPERLHVGPGGLTGGERGTDDAQPVVLDRIEDAQTGVGRVARQQDHLHPGRLRRLALVERQQLAHHREGHARAQHVVLVLALVLGVGVHAFGLEQRVPFLQVEQGARGHSYGQQSGGVVAHGSHRSNAANVAGQLLSVKT